MCSLRGVCTDMMCVDLSIMILDSPTDEKKGGTDLQGCELCQGPLFRLCFWVQTILAQAISLLFASELCFIACFQ